MSDKPAFNIDLVTAMGNSLLATLSPICRRVEIAGSVRRMKEIVHDLDIVAWMQGMTFSKTDLFGNVIEQVSDHSALKEVLLAYGARELKITPKIVRMIIHYRSLLIPVEIYLAEDDGANFSALLQMRTGSAEFNASLAARAIRMALTYTAGYGIFRGEKRVDDGTEDGIFRALNLEPIPIYQREGHYMTANPSPTG